MDLQQTPRERKRKHEDEGEEGGKKKRKCEEEEGEEMKEEEKKEEEMDIRKLGVSKEFEKEVKECLFRLVSQNEEEREKGEQQYQKLKSTTIFPASLMLTLVFLLSNSSLSNDVREKSAELASEGWGWGYNFIDGKFSHADKQAIKSILLGLFSNPQHTKTLRQKINKLVVYVHTRATDDGRYGVWEDFEEFMIGVGGGGGGGGGGGSGDVEVRCSALALGSDIGQLGKFTRPQLLSFTDDILHDPSTKIRIYGIPYAHYLITIANNDPDQLQNIQHFGNVIIEALTTCLESKNFELFTDGFGRLELMMEEEIHFFRPIFVELSEFLFKIAKSDELVDFQSRALEIMVAFAEAKPGAARKTPNFTKSIVELFLDLTTHLPQHNLEEWTQGENQDDMHEAFGFLDRISLALGGRVVVPVLFSILPTFLGSEDWCKRHSGLQVIHCCGEGCRDVLLRDLYKVLLMVLPSLEDPHPRVRWAALNAIGQMCTDFQPAIQIEHGNDILTALLPVLDLKENPRVVSHAAASLVNFFSECPDGFVEPFLEPLLAKLHTILLPSEKPVQIEALSAISAIASNAYAHFRPFYEQFMSFLKDAMKIPTSEENFLFHCRAVECASILGLAVGKELFAKDVEEIDNFIHKFEIAGRDPELPSMHFAWGRICKCLGGDFAPYLERCVPKLLEIINIDPMRHGDFQMESIIYEGVASDVEAISNSLDILLLLAGEMKADFFPYAQPVATTVATNLLSFPLNSSIPRNAALLLPPLLASAKQHSARTGQGNQSVVELWNSIHPHFLNNLWQQQDSVDVERHGVVLESYEECIDLLRENAHTLETLATAHEKIYEVLNHYLEARAERLRSIEEDDLDELEIEKLEKANEQEDIVVTYVASITGKLFKFHKTNYLPIFISNNGLIWKQFFLDPVAVSVDELQSAFCVFIDMVENGGDSAILHIQDLFYAFNLHCTHDSPSIRQAATYGIGALAQFGGEVLGSLVNGFGRVLCEVVESPDARDEENLTITENAICSLSKLCVHQKNNLTHLPKLINAFVSYLPIKDKEEINPTYENLCILLENHTKLILDGDGFCSILELFGLVLLSGDLNEEVTKKVVASIQRLEKEENKRFQGVCGSIAPRVREKILEACKM